MHPDELLADAAADTKPDAPAPIRASHAAVHVAHIDRLLDALGRRRDGIARGIATDLTRVRAHVRSWERCEPDEDVRERWLNALDALDAQAMATLGGNR